MVAKIDDHLGICVGARTTGIVSLKVLQSSHIAHLIYQDFRVHANSVKLTTSNYSNTETPWLNVKVKFLSQPHAGQTGWVKDVFVDSNRSLRLIICFFRRKDMYYWSFGSAGTLASNGLVAVFPSN